MRRNPSLSLFTILIISCLLSQDEKVQASHGSLEDCYSCSKKDSGNMFVCNWGTNMGMGTGDGKIACCSEDNKSTFCQRTSEYNKCSQPYNRMGGSFFNYCPSARESKCGAMNLMASSSKKVISSKKMKYSAANGLFDACYYVIEKNNYTHNDQTGNILVKFEEMDNVAITLHKGRDPLDLENESLGEKDTMVSPGSTYQLENTNGLIVSIHVTQENVDSSFSFEYWTDLDTDLIKQFEEWLESLGGLKWFFVGCLGCIGCLVLCCIGVCINSCCKKQKVHHSLPEPEYNTQSQQNLQQRNFNDVEMVMESIGNGDDTHSQDDKELDTRSEHGRSEHGIKKEDKNSRQAEINFQRTNPFAKDGQKKLQDNQSQ